MATLGGDGIEVETTVDRGGEVVGRGWRWPAAVVKGFLKCEGDEGVGRVLVQTCSPTLTESDNIHLTASESK
ncbi:hypothetical protein Tco_0678191 [Tanacetum coccineum]|uniref:Uncharacterized protein n=1 Tax=Tanacetum coccineum TaxID=301880 RepID=A0ABQ4XFN1_9ASTR